MFILMRRVSKSIDDFVFSRGDLMPCLKRDFALLRNFVQQADSKKEWALSALKSFLEIGVLSLNPNGNYRIFPRLFPDWNFLPRFNGQFLYVVTQDDADKFVIAL